MIFRLLVWLNGITLSLTLLISWVQLHSSSFTCRSPTSLVTKLPFVSVLSQYDNLQYAVGNISIGNSYVFFWNLYSIWICGHPKYVIILNMYRRNMYISHTTFTYHVHIFHVISHTTFTYHVHIFHMWIHIPRSHSTFTYIPEICLSHIACTIGRDPFVSGSTSPSVNSASIFRRRYGVHSPSSEAER